MSKKCCGKCIPPLDDIPAVEEIFIAGFEAGDPDDLREEAIIEADFEELLDKRLGVSNDHYAVGLILDECKALLFEKGKEYNSGRVRMGDYYPRGILSVIDVMNAQLLKIYSLLENNEATIEEVEKTAKNLINYTGIFIGVSRGIIDTPAK